MTINAQKQVFARNVVYTTLGILITNFCLFAGNWAIIRGYGKSVHGQFVWILSVSRLFVLLADLGIASKAGVRQIARQRATEPEKLGNTISRLVFIQLFIGAIITLAIIICARPIASLKSGISVEAYNDIIWSLRLAGSWILLQMGIRLCMMISIGLERMLNVLLTNPVSELLKLVWIVVCILFGLELIWVFAGWTAAQALALINGTALLRPLEREFNFRIRLHLEPVRSYVSVVVAAFPYYVSYVSLLGIPSLMPLLLGVRMADTFAIDAEISFLHVCWSLSLVSRFISSTTGTTIFPRVAHLDASSSDRSEIGSIITQVSRIVALFSSGLFALFLAFGGVLLGSVYGPAYAEVLPLLLTICAATSIENYSQQLDQVLMAMNSARLVMWGEIVKLSTAVVAAWWLIPVHGVFGVAIGIMAAMVISTILKIAATRKLVKTVGLGSLGTMLLIFIVLWIFKTFTAGCLAESTWLKYLPYTILPIWLVMVLALRLLLPSEILRWTGIFVRTLMPPSREK